MQQVISEGRLNFFETKGVEFTLIAYATIALLASEVLDIVKHTIFICPYQDRIAGSASGFAGRDLKRSSSSSRSTVTYCRWQ